MTAPRQYVVGFIFDPSSEFVLLLRKTHPEWQRGKLNGVGGHVEPGETHPEAMAREGAEELSRDVEWTRFAMLYGAGWVMSCFFAFPTWMGVGDIPEVNDVGEEFTVRPVFQVTSGKTKEPVIPNVRWLLPLALADSVEDQPHTVTVWDRE